MRDAEAILDLRLSFGKTHNRNNMSRLKFFEATDAKLGEADAAPEPLLGHDVVMRYEIKRVCNARTHNKVREFWMEWQGYDQSQNRWVSRESLMQDVLALKWAFERNPSKSHLERQRLIGRLWFPGLCWWCKPRGTWLPPQR